jgi:hypothetical protein
LHEILQLPESQKPFEGFTEPAEQFCVQKEPPEPDASRLSQYTPTNIKPHASIFGMGVPASGSDNTQEIIRFIL